jgi:hypothetical protein
MQLKEYSYVHHIYLGSWSNLNSNSYRQINEMPGYNEEITEAKKISIEVCTYMHIHTYMYMYINIYTCIYVYVYVYIVYVHTYLYSFIHTHIYIYIYICIYEYMNMYENKHMCVHCVYISVSTHLYV